MEVGEKTGTVGEIVEVKSTQYGTYYITCLGYIDLIHGNPEYEDRPDMESVFSWLKKYHPKHFFSASSFMTGEHDWSFYIYAPLDVDNKTWFKDNPDCQYMKEVSTKGVKTLPVGLTTKKLNTWLEQSKPYLITSINPVS